MADELASLDPTAEDKRWTREMLLMMLTRETHTVAAAALAEGLASLDPTAEDRRQARKAVLELLARETAILAAEVLASGLACLEPDGGRKDARPERR